MVSWPAEGGPLKGQRHTQLAGAPDGVLRVQGKHRLPQSRHRPGRIVPRVPRAVLQPSDALGSIAPQPPYSPSALRSRSASTACPGSSPVAWPAPQSRLARRLLRAPQLAHPGHPPHHRTCKPSPVYAQLLS